VSHKLLTSDRSRIGEVTEHYDMANAERVPIMGFIRGSAGGASNRVQGQNPLVMGQGEDP